MKFSTEDIEKFDRWQSDGLVHPMTCGGRCAPSHPLKMNHEQLYCPNCDYVQDWIPNVVFETDGGKTLTDPMRELFKGKIKEE